MAQKQCDLKIGDTIQCHDQEDMLNVHGDLMNEGIFTDWLDITATDKTKWRLTVVGFDYARTDEHI